MQERAQDGSLQPQSLIERLKTDEALRQDIQLNKVKAERIDAYLRDVWRQKKDEITAMWKDQCVPEYRKELLTICHDASQNGAAVYFPLDDVVKELELSYLLRDGGLEFIVLIQNVAEYGVAGAYYHCTVGADGSVGDMADPHKTKAFEKFAVKEGFFPSEQKDSSQQAGAAQPNEKDVEEVVDAIVLLRRYLVVMFIVTVLMTLDFADTAEIERLLAVQPASASRTAAIRSQERPAAVEGKRSCFTCGATDKPLSVCSKCKKTYYCSRECQRSDWKRHKPTCTG